MPIALSTALDLPAPLIPPRKRWTRDECKLLESSGIWEQQRLELINGELISKMGQKSHSLRHDNSRLYTILVSASVE